MHRHPPRLPKLTDRVWLAFVMVSWIACAAETPQTPPSDPGAPSAPMRAPSADVIAVETTRIGTVDSSPQGPSRVRFAVTVRSDETGCDRYADWWEVVSLDGTLLQRRILTHSHVDEQPFTRSAPPLDLPPDQVVLVRAHLHPLGYVGEALQGSLETGWSPVAADSVAPGLDRSEPLPAGCRF